MCVNIRCTFEHHAHTLKRTTIAHISTPTHKSFDDVYDDDDDDAGTFSYLEKKAQRNLFEAKLNGTNGC